LFKNGDYREALVFFTPLLKEQPDASDEKQRLAVLIGMSHYGWEITRPLHPIFAKHRRAMSAI